jgi:tetratricopeptide (TPR) repeat protein
MYRPISFGPYTDRCRKVAWLANISVKITGDVALFPYHLLAALAVEGSGVGAHLLRNHGIDLETLVEVLAPGLTNDPDNRLNPPIAWASHMILYSAEAESDFLGDEHIGTEHLLLALLAAPDAKIINAFGTSLPSHGDVLKSLLSAKAEWRTAGEKSSNAYPMCDIAACSPSDAEFLNHGAWALAVSGRSSQRDLERAIELANKACELTDFKKASCLDTLAVCYAARGQFEEAMRHIEAAIRICPFEHLAGCEARLELFQASQPYRE